MKTYRQKITPLIVAFCCSIANSQGEEMPKRFADLDVDMDAEFDEEAGKAIIEDADGPEPQALKAQVPIDAQHFKDSIFWFDGWLVTGELDLREHFNPDELREVLAIPKEKREEQEYRRIMVLLLHAAHQKDESFQSLLKDTELREETNVRLALCAYDYMLNGSEEALDAILAQLAIEPIGSDCDAIVALKILDEWDRSVRAFRKHFVAYDEDSPAVAALTGFQSTRAYLYPKKYAKWKKAIGAPMTWTDPLPALKEENK